MGMPCHYFQKCFSRTGGLTPSLLPVVQSSYRNTQKGGKLMLGKSKFGTSIQHKPLLGGDAIFHYNVSVPVHNTPQYRTIVLRLQYSPTHRPEHSSGGVFQHLAQYFLCLTHRNSP